MTNRLLEVVPRDYSGRRQDINDYRSRVSGPVSSNKCWLARGILDAARKRSCRVTEENELERSATTTTQGVRIVGYVAITIARTLRARDHRQSG